MSGALFLEPLAPTRLGELRDALHGEGMPNDDIGADDCRFYCVRRGDDVLGYAGLQGSGDDRLLRSMWVRPTRRRDGIGIALLAAIEQEALATGTRTLHLLTTTASAFFHRHGYVARERRTAPSSVAATREFANLCPATASYLVKVLRDPA